MRSATSALASGRGWLARLELDTRLLGMFGAWLALAVFFNTFSSGNFLKPENLWNISVQSSSVAVMATGMVFIIVSRNIDLSVGSLLAFLGYTMAMVQVQWLTQGFTVGPFVIQPLAHIGTWWIWIVALAIGLGLGALIGALHGFLIAYGKVPSFVVTLGGLLVWRGVLFQYQQGQTLSPLDETFSIIGGRQSVSIGLWPSWAIGIIACVVIGYILVQRRRTAQKYGFPVRPMWAHLTVTAIGCLGVLAAVWIATNYFWPPALASRYAVDHGITEPAGGLKIATGISQPVLIMIGVAIVMAYLASRRPFGRYVWAIGGNPEAAELGGINTRWVIMRTYILMGMLCAVAGAIDTGRLNSAVTGLGQGNELDVIAAAVIGGTSFSGGIGTVPGAILGAVFMRSLRVGLQLFGWDTPAQDIVAGAVLVIAVGIDTFIHRKAA